jgi:Uncharacterized protein conserved in bacteria
MKFKSFILIIMLFIALFLFSSNVSAFSFVTPAAFNASPIDVGNHNDYDGGGGDGGGFDFGGGGFDWDSGGTSSSSGGSGGIIETIVVIIVVVVIIIFKSKFSSKKSSPTAPNIPLDQTVQISDQIRQRDPNFSADKFIAFGKEVFVTLQNAWTARDWRKVRPFESDSLFKVHEQQLQEYINTGKINIIENICVNTAYLSEFYADQQFEYLTMYLNVRMIDYIIDEKSRNVLKGNPKINCYMKYKMKFIRSINTMSHADLDKLNVTNCPNCGAPTQITSSGECEYCNSVITTGNYNWVLTDLSHI